jgi:hypothetical protein
MPDSGQYATHTFPVKRSPGDRLLLRLGPRGRFSVLCLTQPTRVTRQRLRQFARTIVRNRRYPRFVGGAQ